MANLDDVFDDALRAFDEDHAEVACSAQHEVAECHVTSSHSGPDTEASSQAAGATTGTSAAAHSSPTTAAPKAATAAPQLPPRRKAAKPFDPLGSKGKAASSSKSSGKAGPAVAGKSEAAELSQQLESLLAEWSQGAVHPLGDPSAAGPGPGSTAAAAAAAAGGSLGGFPGMPFTAPGTSTAGATSSSNVLRALAEHTQRTVEDQARLSGTAAAAAGAGGEAGGEGSHVDQVVDMVMQHLLSKDVLYQPMKEIRDKYPPWLAAHEGGAGGVTPSDLARYKQQYTSICALVDMYESQPDNFQGILQHLQEMQACGEPPADIVEDMSAAIAADLPHLAGNAGGSADSTSSPSPATAAAAAAAAAGLGAGVPSAGDDGRMDALLGELLGNAFPGGLGRPAGLSGGGLDGLPKELAGNCPIQ